MITPQIMRQPLLSHLTPYLRRVHSWIHYNNSLMFVLNLNEHLPSLTAIDIVTTDNPVGEDQLEIATDYNIESLQQNAPITKGIYNYLATGTKKPTGYTDKSLNRYILEYWNIDGLSCHPSCKIYRYVTVLCTLWRRHVSTLGQNSATEVNSIKVSTRVSC